MESDELFFSASNAKIDYEFNAFFVSFELNFAYGLKFS
jgi:hypothetical protein